MSIDDLICPLCSADLIMRKNRRLNQWSVSCNCGYSKKESGNPFMKAAEYGDKVKKQNENNHWKDKSKTV